MAPRSSGRRRRSSAASERMMDEGDEPQALGLARETLRRGRQHHAIEHHRTSIRQRSERRGHGIARHAIGVGMPSRELVDGDNPSHLPQTFDDAPVEEITAGDLIEPPRNQKIQLPHAISPS
jgi:hypothetical protein